MPSQSPDKGLSYESIKYSVFQPILEDCVMVWPELKQLLRSDLGQADPDISFRLSEELGDRAGVLRDRKYCEQPGKEYLFKEFVQWLGEAGLLEARQ